MRVILFSILISVLFVSCGSLEQKKNVNKKLSDVNTSELKRNDMVSNLERILRESKKNDEKKIQQALVSYRKTLSNIDALNLELQKNKVVLFEHLAEENYSIDKVNILRKNMRKVYQRKFKTMFDGVLELKNILGVNYSKARGIMLREELDFFNPDLRRR